MTEPLSRDALDRTVREILSQQGVFGQAVPLESQGVANHIYVTEELVIRIPTDHPEALSDAYTESVAAPLVKAQGIRTPELLVFDDTRTLIDRPYSIWERIHGITLEAMRDTPQWKRIWYAVGQELGRLHTGIRECPDPHGWLDDPAAGRGYTVETLLCRLKASCPAGAKLIGTVCRLQNSEGNGPEPVFVHGDTNPTNMLCCPDGGLLALIDWGDAGWADPAVDFYMIPGGVLLEALRGYADTAPGLVTEPMILQVLVDKIWEGLEEGTDLQCLDLQIRAWEEELSGLR